MNNPVIVSTAPFDGYDLAVAIEEIALTGADGIEIAFIEGYTDPFTEDDFTRGYADEISSYLTKHNLPCLSFSAHMDLTKANGLEIFKRRMTFARRLGAEFIITNAAPLAKKEEFLSTIKALGAFAKDIGIKIGLENPGDGKINVLDTAQAAAPVIDQIAL
ncbi:MAG: TIM barrel protein, partial [Desulfocapsaceae bacterium]|nr:TIM barrel protein [Desulfocapsaceae bacterium]